MEHWSAPVFLSASVIGLARVSPYHRCHSFVTLIWLWCKSLVSMYVKPNPWLQNVYHCWSILQGYALFSHCVVLFLATFIHTGHDHLLFYGLWLVLGGLAAVRMVGAVSVWPNTRFCCWVDVDHYGTNVQSTLSHPARLLHCCTSHVLLALPTFCVSWTRRK